MKKTKHTKKSYTRSFFGIILNPGMIFLYITLSLGSVLLFQDKEEAAIDIPMDTQVERSLGSLRPLRAEEKPTEGKGEGLKLVSLTPLSKSFFINKASNPLGIELDDVTLESGIEFSHQQGGMMLTALNDVIGAGVCVSDYDQDGYQDIYAVNGSGFSHYYGKKWWWSKTLGNVLYRNMGDGTFKDLSERAGVGNSAWGMGCAFGDYNNDGYSDLYVTNYGANILYRNNGDGTFSDVTNEAGVGDEGWGTSIAWADYDNDGDLDLYVVNYVAFDKTMTPVEPNSAFKTIQPLMMKSGLFDGQKNVLYRNNGDGTFKNVTENAGVENSPGRGLGVAFFDYDNDGDQDIYIANDKSRNILYRNNGDSTFTDVGGLLGVDSPLSGMGVTIGDYDNDGDMDIFSTNPQSETNALFRNLLVNNRDSDSYKRDGFIDATVDSGLGEEVSVGYFGWSTEFVDIDNDGFLDLFVANGHGMVDFDNPQTTIGQRNQLFRNNRDGTFTEISGQVGKALKTMGSSRGATIADFDNDGDLDIFVVNNNGKGQMLETNNTTGNHWLNIRVKGKESNRDGIGAKVKIKAGGLTQIREVRSGSGYLSQKDTRLAFGLGDALEVDELEILWPSGIVQKIQGIQSDQFIIIVEGINKAEIDERFPKKEKPIITAKSLKNPEKIKVAETIKGPRENVRKDPSLKQVGTVKKVKVQKKVQPLVRKKETNLRLEAVRVIRHIPGERSFEVLVGLLKDEDLEIKKIAVNALGEIKRITAIKPLLLLLKKEDDKELRKEIIKAFGNLSDEKIFEPLIAYLTDDDVDLRREAAKSLSRLFEKEEKIFKSSMLKMRIAVTALIKALSDSDMMVRKYALKGLGFSESYRAVVPVVEAFGDKNEEVREEAVRAAGLLRDRRAIGPLLEVLNDQSEVEVEVKVQTIFALKRLGSDVVLEPILKVAAEGSKEARLRMCRVIQELLRNEESVLVNKDKIILFLHKGIKDNEPEIRKAVLEIVGLLKSNEVEKVVMRGMRDTDIEVRREAVQVGSNMNLPEIIGEIKKLINDRDKEIRKEAILALSKSAPDSKAPELLKEIIKDEIDQEIHLAALASLLRIESDVAIQLIKDELNQEKPRAQSVLVEILGLTSNQEAIKPLLVQLEKENSIDVQKKAVTSLRRFVKKREVFGALLKVLRDSKRDLGVREEALHLLVDWGNRNNRASMVVPFLSQILKNKKDPLRGAVIQGVASMGQKKNAPLFLEILNNKAEKFEIRQKALSALVNLSPEKALTELEKNFIFKT